MPFSEEIQLKDFPETRQGFSNDPPSDIDGTTVSVCQSYYVYKFRGESALPCRLSALNTVDRHRMTTTLSQGYVITESTADALPEGQRRTVINYRQNIQTPIKLSILPHSLNTVARNQGEKKVRGWHRVLHTRRPSLDTRARITRLRRIALSRRNVGSTVDLRPIS